MSRPSPPGRGRGRGTALDRHTGAYGGTPEESRGRHPRCSRAIAGWSWAESTGALRTASGSRLDALKSWIIRYLPAMGGSWWPTSRIVSPPGERARAVSGRGATHCRSRATARPPAPDRPARRGAPADAAEHRPDRYRRPECGSGALESPRILLLAQRLGDRARESDADRTAGHDPTQ